MDIDFPALRVKMVDGQVRTTDVTSQKLLGALLTVPREQFVEPSQRELAYIDEDLRYLTAEGDKPRYLMEASPFAKLVQLAEIGANDFVLDIGCGTGYSSAIFSRLASSVVALESDAVLADKASATLSALGYDNVAVVKGDLNAGYPKQGPYDVIFLEGSVEQVPATLLAQLKNEGRLVAVEGVGNAGIARLYVKSGDVVTARRGFNAAIKPLPGFERAAEFTF